MVWEIFTYQVKLKNNEKRMKPSSLIMNIKRREGGRSYAPYLINTLVISRLICSMFKLK